MSRRAALVTGASRGIGRSIATALCEEGYAVTLVARGAAELSETAEQLRAGGHTVEAVVADVLEPASVSAALAGHRERFGRLDVLVSNAGSAVHGPFEEVPHPEVARQFAMHLGGAYHLTGEAAGLLRAAGREHGKALVVFVSSILGKFGTAEVAAYSAAKAGLIALAQSLHAEMSEAGVQVTALCPAFVATGMTDWVPGVAKSAMVQPGDLAEAVRFLLRTSPACAVPEIQLVRSADRFFGAEQFRDEATPAATAGALVGAATGKPS